MNTDLPRMERVPAEGPTYAMRLGAAMAEVDRLKAADRDADALVICGRDGHDGRATQQPVAEVWLYGNEVLWRSTRLDPELGPYMSDLLDRWKEVGHDWKASGKTYRKLQMRYVIAHLLNVPPGQRVESTYHERITLDADGNLAPGWHTSEWPTGTSVTAYCPKHGELVPDEAVIIAAMDRRETRVVLT